MTVTRPKLDSEIDRLAALRMQLLEMHPFWGYMLLQVALLPASGLPAYAATDSYRHIWFNPKKTMALNNQEVSFVLLHLLCHQVLAATERRGPREPLRWERAVDYAINCMIEEINLAGLAQWNAFLYQRPPKTLFNKKYHGWITELIYEDLRPTDDLNIVIDVEVGGSRNGHGGGGDQGQGLTLCLPINGGRKVTVPGLVNHRGGIDLHVPLQFEPDQQELLRERIIAAAENYHVNSERGHLPEELLRKTKLFATGKIPWRQLLRRFAETTLGKDDYTLSRPNKRYLLHDLVVPGLHSESVPTIVVALDTSSSMSPRELREVATEIQGLLENSEDITLIVADAKVQQVVKFTQLENFLQRGEFLGGGGTDHICVFNYIKKHKLEPNFFIGLSDLYSVFPSRPPSYPVLWVAPEHHRPPPWGKVIVL